MDNTDQIFKGPDGVALRFYYQPSLNNFQSDKHGRLIYDTSLMVEVMVPGMRESTPQVELERVLCEEASNGGDRIVKRSPKYDEYREAVEAFKRNNGEGIVEGTPISSWPQIDAGTAATLKAQNIHTVEQLAAVSDGHLSNIGIGGRNLRERAQAFISTRDFGVPSARMASENTQLRERVAFLENRVQELESILANKASEESAKVSTDRNVIGAPAQTLAPDAMSFTPPPPPTPEPPNSAPLI